MALSTYGIQREHFSDDMIGLLSKPRYFDLMVRLRERIAETGDVTVDTTSVDTNGLIGKSSGGDFTTAYTSGTTITLSNLPAYHPTMIADDIATVIQIDNTGDVVQQYSRDDVAMTMAANVLTVAGATFAATDTFVVYTNIHREGATAAPETTIQVDSTDVAAGTNYYPSSAGQTLTPYTNLNVQGVTSGGVTFTLEVTNDDDWIDITQAGYRKDDNSSGNTSLVDQSFSMDWQDLQTVKWRIKSVTSDATNAVKYVTYMS